MFFSRVLAASALVGSAVAQGTFSILTPGGPNLWWVAGSQNTLAWTCHTNPPATTYQILVANGNQTILAAPMAIIANVPNADCSHTITQQQAAFEPATNYTVIIADAIDQTKVYATSQPFEVKALGASYPPTSATPVEGASSTSASGSAASNTASSSSGAAAASGSSKPNGAANVGAPFTVGAGALALVGAVFGML
ncbi:hypothetical protein EVG20_g3656 [Dentipellis fragilis]|uniref:Yeast cell wall synthesis Kre9/Knh1-like N-terminal domain-containing protein n=1 Tax=Dentipellis fragilis TaxID=205917 RepID=A0A4Y9Z040_9AGAM|nr:hypothetical protein EVG20_g3656 [Dentipellis fragilis]